MIRTNLSTRPFYNERAVHLWLLAIAVAVAAATIFNVSRVMRYSRSDTRLATQASRDEARAADLRRQAARLRASVDPRQVDFASADARQANDLIDRRTFSWTELFNRFETTLPDEVRITAVRPRIDRERGIVLTIIVSARSVDDVDTFIENLEGTGAFKPTCGQPKSISTTRGCSSVLEAGYVPGGRSRRAAEGRAAVTLWKRILVEKRALIIPLALGVIVNIAAYALVVYPLGVKTAGAADRAAAASQSLQAAEREHAAARELVLGKSRADQELSTFFDKVLPADLPSARRLTYTPLPSLARKGNVKFLDRHYDRAEPQ